MAQTADKAEALWGTTLVIQVAVAKHPVTPWRTVTDAGMPPDVWIG
jgi:hypothetical protein